MTLIDVLQEDGDNIEPNHSKEMVGFLLLLQLSNHTNIKED